MSTVKEADTVALAVARIFAQGQIIQQVTYRKGEVWDSPLRASPFIKAVMREGIPL